jgi:hypothetical protein
MVQHSQLRALLSEPQEGNRSFNALARDLGVTISEFDPLETASEQAARDPTSYFRQTRALSRLPQRKRCAEQRQGLGGPQGQAETKALGHGAAQLA